MGAEPPKLKLGAALKVVDGAAAEDPNEKGEAAPNDEAAGGAPKPVAPVGGPNGVVAGAPNGAAADDLAVMSPNAGVAGLAAPKVNGAVVVLVALPPKEPKLGAAAVEGVVCCGVPKLNWTFGASDGVVVAGAAALADPKEKRAGAAGAADDAAVDGAVNPKPPAAGLGASLGNDG